MDQTSIYNTLDKNLYRITTGGQPDPNLQSPNSLDNDLSTVGGRVLPVSLGGNIQAAIDTVFNAGGGEVRLLTGTYNLTSDIALKEHVNLVGTGFGSIIDFSGGAYQLKIVGGDSYSTGTVSVSINTTSVVGSGTSWTSSMIGQSILITEFWYEITNVTDATHLTIGGVFLSPTISSSIYVIATPVSSSNVKDLTLQNSSVALLKAQYINGTNLEGLVFTAGLTGIDGDDSSFINIINCSAIECGEGFNFKNFFYGSFFNWNALHCTNNGLTLNNCTDWGIEIFCIHNCGGTGLSISNCSNNGYEDFTIKNNTVNGIDLVINNQTMSFSDGIIENNIIGIKFTATTNTCQFTQLNLISNTSDGIKLVATSDRNIIIGCDFTTNGGYGVNVAASSCDNNIITRNTYIGNSSGTVSDSGTGTILDTVKDSDVVFTDVTTGNVTSTKHGYAPKSPGDATKFLNGGTTPGWSTPGGADFLLVQVFS